MVKVKIRRDESHNDNPSRASHHKIYRSFLHFKMAIDSVLEVALLRALQGALLWARPDNWNAISSVIVQLLRTVESSLINFNLRPE